VPQSNKRYWETKLSGNVARDRRIDSALLQGGWAVLRAWEHEIATNVVSEIGRVLEARVPDVDEGRVGPTSSRRHGRRKDDQPHGPRLSIGPE